MFTKHKKARFLPLSLLQSMFLPKKRPFLFSRRSIGSFPEQQLVIKPTQKCNPEFLQFQKFRAQHKSTRGGPNNVYIMLVSDVTDCKK